MSERTSEVPDEQSAAYYRALLKPVYRGQRFIVIGGPLAGLTGLGTSLEKLGAEATFLLASSIGAGNLPELDPHRWHSFGHRSESVSDEFRRYESTLRKLPDDALAKLERFDPERKALGIGAIVLSDIPQIGGRGRYAHRPLHWAALEDKTQIESFWDALGVETAPSEVIGIEREPLLRAFRRLDRGSGCVVAGDCKSGTMGGAELTRRLRAESEAGEMLETFAPECDRVRVMPFLEGVPCSIHGIVLPDFVVVLRPVELVVLRRPDSSQFVYAGVSTYWDPPDRERTAMRALARGVGEQLRERIGYRGAFTIDGVLSDSGFLPTELNPRFGAGLAPIGAAIPKLPLVPLVLAISQGERLDYQGERLERALVEAADAQRSGRGSLPLRVERSETEFLQVITLDGAPRMAAEGEPGDGVFMLGPGPMGCFFSYSPVTGALPPGTFLAPHVVEAFGLADREFGTGIGPVVAAEERRTR
jgi:hypothetical protein